MHTVQFGGVRYGLAVPVKGEAGVTRSEGIGRHYVFKTNLNGDVHAFSTTNVLTIGREGTLVVGKGQRSEFEVVLVALRCQTTPRVGERHTHHTVAQDDSGGHGQPHFVVPFRSQSETDVGLA